MKKINGQQLSPEYSIPTNISLSTLIKSLVEMGVVPTLTQENFTKPNPDLALKVFGSCMEKFLDETIEDIKQRNREYISQAPTQGESLDVYTNILEFIEVFKKM